jgi:hypothetical protein
VLPKGVSIKTLINQLFQIIDEFGLFFSRPKFRIVWTGDCFEKRLGTYEDYEGTLRIRTVTEVREVPKYPYVNPPWWMLERAVEFQDDSIKRGDLYEPLYLFRHFGPKGEYGEFLPPRADMAILAAKMSLVKRPKRTLDMDKNEFEEKEAKGEKDIYEQICDRTSYLAHQFHHKEAIIMDGKSTELPTSPNLMEK